MSAQPGIIQLLGLAASVSLLSGWRLYLCMFATGLAMRLGWLPLPEHLTSLQVLASPWVIGCAALAAAAEFLADKIAIVDSVWDTVHTLIRPIGGALLALAIVDPSRPEMQVIAFILGGGAALAAHGGKAGTRALVNTSPEPFSNIAVSSAEDLSTAGLLAVAYAFPWAAGGVALLVLAGSVTLLVVARRLIRSLFGRDRVQPPH